MSYNNDKPIIADKEYRRKVYEENKKSYKKMRDTFLYGVSANFRQIRKDTKKEILDLEEETDKAYEEME